MSDSKKHKGSSAATKLRISKRKAGFNSGKGPSKKDRELDEPNNPDNHNKLEKKKKSKNDNPKDRELDEETEGETNKQ